MKTISKPTLKLSLNKQTVTTLNETQMNVINCGDGAMLGTINLTTVISGMILNTSSDDCWNRGMRVQTTLQ